MMFNEFMSFFTSGELSKLELAQDKASIFACLGQPDDVLENHELILYKYDGLELTLLDDKIVIINLGFLDGDLLLPRDLGLSLRYKSQDIQDVISILESSEVGWHICNERSFDDCLVIVTEANVLIYYSLIDRCIDKIQLSSLDEKLYKYV